MGSWPAMITGLILAAFSKDFTSKLQDADPNGLCRPEKVHLALTGDPTEMRVSWSTKQHNCHGNVYFGQAFGDGINNIDTPLGMETEHMDADSYGPEDFCGQPAASDDFDPPHLHTAVMTNLIPGSLYDYRIGKHGKVLQFRAAPDTQPEASFRFIAYGDMGESVHHHAKSPGAHFTASQVLKEVDDNGASLVVHLGDISYADGVHKVWNTFLEQIEPYASRVPYQIVIGNHEYDWKTGKEHRHHPTDASGREKMYDPDWGNYGNDSGGECGVTASKLFPMPGSENVLDEASRYAAANHRPDLPNPPFWYSYDYGNVHFTTLSSEHDLTKHSQQRKWLEQELASVDRCVTPWLVVAIHRPLYVVHPHKSNRIVGDHLRKHLEDLLEEYQVDLVLSGHIHAFARTCNMFREKCIKNRAGGMTHVTLGNGGRKLSEVKHEQPDWLEYADRQWGFARITVEGSKSFLLEYVSSKTGKVRDSVKLEIDASAMERCHLDHSAAPLHLGQKDAVKTEQITS